MHTRAAFLAGVRAGAPFILIIVPFAMLFGVIATEAGLDLAQTMVMTSLVIAGASQFTALQLMSEQAPALIVLATSLAVNLRMAMYSASLVPHLGPAPLWQRALASYLMVDQVYGISILRFAQDPPLTLPQKMAFYFGTAAPVVPLWYGFTWVGAVAGARIPPAFALDFAIPIAFLALIGPALRTPAHVAAAAVSVAATLALVWVPYNLGLILAAIAAMATGALVEVQLERWKARAA